MSSWVSIPLKEHNKIRRSKAMQAALAAEAAKVAAQANSRGGTDGYRSESELEPNPDVTVKGGSAQAHVWPSGEAVGVENRDAILMGLAASQGMKR